MEGGRVSKRRVAREVEKEAESEFGKEVVW